MGTANGTQEHGIGRLGQSERGLGQGVARGVIARAADGRLFHFDFQTIAGKRLQDFHRLGDDFGPDAVTGQNCDLHIILLVVYAEVSEERGDIHCNSFTLPPLFPLCLSFHQENSQGASALRRSS